MAVPVFTTWTDLYTALLNAYAEFVANRIQLTEITLDTGSTTRTFKYQDPDKLLRAIKEVKAMAEMESGAASGRTYAKQAGGGRW